MPIMLRKGGLGGAREVRVSFNSGKNQNAVIASYWDFE